MQTTRVQLPLAVRPSIIPRQAPRVARTLVARVHNKQGSHQQDKSALNNLGSYLSEAAASIFSPMANNVPWPSEPSGYTGNVTHHDVARLRKLHTAIVETREKVMGCTDPAAINYSASANTDDGTCEYIDLLDRTPEVGHDDDEHSGLRGFVVGAVSRVFGHNFKTENEPETWEEGPHTGYQGHVSRRNRRDVQRMLKFEALVKKTLEDAEKKVDK